MALCLPVEVIRRGDAAAIAFYRFEHPDELMRIAIGERLQESSVDDTEHRRIHPDAQRQRRDCKSREAGFAKQHAQPVAQILNQLVFKPSWLHGQGIPESAETAAQ